MTKQISLGSWIQLPDTFSAEIMAKSGFDWLAIDMEHGLIGIEDAYKLIQVIGLAGSMPLVRLQENDPSTIRRVMDAGAAGIIVPMVNSKADALKAVKALKYTPTGKRSFGLGRAHDYGKKFLEYVNSVNSKSLLIAQIEHVEAVSNLDEILSVKEINGIFIGPYDLSGSMGIPGEFDNKDFEKTISLIVEKTKKSKKMPGIHIVHADPKELKSRVEQGFSFIGYGMDTVYLQKGIDVSKNNF